ncbi:glucans biosynthesis glucosyltransferase MdoH [Marinobacter maroccanus]|uniref:Glucans biosynthesis glucosyltransferase H n=1 Tax=Marinobacter maroccanus TaxID=2055143 RepID=A0A2S5ZCV2_9GAMM|nr:glucans biosynthesis glucosyltransferase MdoH [Marinobacter maroccanus]PPI85229.1 glucans biosynthesis glucosyltransferase MdoH [Marinobacter maroccanus]
MSNADSWRPIAFRRRFLLVLLVAAQTLAGIFLFAQTVPDQAGSGTTAALLTVFGVLFAWIGVGFWTAVFGFVALRFGGDSWSLSRRVEHTGPGQSLSAPTAVVMPICHEPVQHTLGGLKAIIQDLEQQGQAGAVDFYVLSDSRDPDIWLEEQATGEQIRGELGPHQQLFYRRRNVNLNYKSGNIADFLRRWGRRYRYMVVLDADSLLSANCITRLIQLMEARPEAGIIQTAPRLARAESRFGRLQQFANRCYGRLYSAGLAAIQLGEATYWGHNAIIRVAPFMAHCGLRKLRGPGLFRGPVLSHDFIEAALMGRAGYEVWLEPAIAGSFEESPPTLEDDLIRDRRWCRGNLQHLWLLATLGKIRLAHRMALLTGVLSYLASPLWLIFLGLSGYVALAGPTPEPSLPGVMATTEAGSGAGALLVAVTALLLFGPRILAVTDHRLASRTPRFGGLFRLCSNTLLETIAALALAPIRMLVHTLHVVRALLNLKVGWQGQNRSGGLTPGLSLQHFGSLLFSAAAGLALIHWHAPTLTPWALPVMAPVLLAPALACWLGRNSGPVTWLHVPEDGQVARVIERANATPPLRHNPGRLSWFEQTVLSPVFARACQYDAQPATGKKARALERLVNRCATEGKQALTHRELSLICNHPEALEALHWRAWHAAPESPWRAVLDRMAQSVESATPTSVSLPRRREELGWVEVAS